MKTWDKRSSFEYTGSVKEGTRIRFGSNNVINVSKEDYSKLLNHFRGRTVSIGTRRDYPPKKSCGEWLQQNITKTAIASYVGPILINEGYAVKIGRSDIQFKSGLL